MIWNYNLFVGHVEPAFPNHEAVGNWEAKSKRAQQLLEGEKTERELRDERKGKGKGKKGEQQH